MQAKESVTGLKLHLSMVNLRTITYVITKLTGLYDMNSEFNYELLDNLLWKYIMELQAYGKWQA